MLLISSNIPQLAENMGLEKLHEKLNDKELSEFFSGLFPKDHPQNTRFAINFFTSIGLGPLTDDLRNHLQSIPQLILNAQHQVSSTSSSSESSSEESSSSSSEDSSEGNNSDSESRKS